ncbi:MAG: hypothetical protein H8E22_01790 [Candidatus Cloacimonetes bacterium]|nr:hypothetical protein [Candidatus Cloacimonadota bacterium]
MIFGIGDPIINSSVINSGTDLQLKHCLIHPGWEIRSELDNESPLTGYISYINLWTHYEFKWHIFLYNLIEDHDASGIFADPESYLSELFKILDEDIRIKAHKYEYDYSINRPSSDEVANYLQKKEMFFGEDSVSGSSVVLNDNEIDNDDYYKNLEITATHGATTEKKTITGYVGSTRTATLSSALSFTPASTDTYTIDGLFHCTKFEPKLIDNITKAIYVEIIMKSVFPMEVGQIPT